MVFLFAFLVVVTQYLVNQVWFCATLDFSSWGGSKNRNSTVIYWDCQIEGKKYVNDFLTENNELSGEKTKNSLERKQNVLHHGRFYLDLMNSRQRHTTCEFLGGQEVCIY